MDTTNNHATRFQQCYVELTNIARLEADWDGQGAAKPRQDLLATAIWFVKLLDRSQLEPPPCRIVPTPGGEILLEWQENGGRIYREAEVVKPSVIQWFMRDRETGECRHFTETIERTTK